MLEKYNDTPAAIAIILYTLGCAFYVFQLLFMTESWLAENGMGPETVGLARVLAFTWLGILVGLVRTFTNGPDGNSTFFIVLIVAQLGLVLNLWHQYLFPADAAAAATVLDDSIAVSVLAILLLIGWFRIRARL
jgi:hypothetical protein|tara:strand:- start:424 stop:825 length:402 start_codon:yes stop_codon:yes gene_type:complete